MLAKHSCIKIAIAILVSLVLGGAAFATVLIDPTSAGGFELGATFAANGWTVVNDTANTWQVGAASTPYAGTNAAFVSNDGGITNAYTNTSYSTSHFYRDVTVPTGELSITLSFYWKGNGESGWDRLLIYTAPTSVTPVAGAPASNSTTWTGATLVYTQTTFPQATYALVTLPLPSELAGTTFRLIFTWQDDNSVGTNPPASVDNISLVSVVPPPPLVGGNTYPINGVDNPPTSFATITSAMNYAASAGVSGTGQVLLELSTGYTGESAYPVTFYAITGLSSTLGITVRPALGTSPFTLEGAGGTAIFYMDGIDYLTIDGRAGGVGTAKNIILSNTSTAAPTVRFINGVTYNTIKYCTIKGVSTASGGVFYISGGSSNNNNLIENCDVTAGATFPTYGFYFYGVSSSYNKFNTISKCKVYDFSGSGIYFYWYDTATTIQDCEIYTRSQQTSTAMYGINISSASATYGTQILRNKIYDFNTSAATPTFYGINIQTASATLAHTIVNNFIALDANVTNPGATIYGIREYYSTVGTLYNIYYNSIYIGGTAVTGGSTYGIYRGYQSTSNSKNNIVFNNRVNGTGTGKHYCYYASNTGAGLVSNNNDFYAPNPNGFVGYWTADRATLADWKTASGQDLNSVSQNPNFINIATTDLHINATIATRLESGGIPIAGITTDIDGNTRAGGTKIHNNVQPDIGADEFIGTAIDEMPPAITYTLMPNTPFTTNRTLTATITDYVSGVANDPARAPRLYYKKNTGGTWVAETVLTPTGNNWTFNFNHSRIGGVLVGDTVFYYVQATDSSNNTGTNPLGGASAPYFYTIMVSMSGNYNIGTGQTYLTLKAFFNALNNSAITGDVTGTITSDLTETTPDTLNQLSCFGGTWGVTIMPSTAPRIVYTISGAIAGPLVCLNGADNITFYGMGKNLVFRNTSTSGKVFQLMNDATYNTITSCIIEGCGSSSSYPSVFITTSTGTIGNVYNVITGNDIRDLSTTGTRPYAGVYVLGTATALNSNNTISNNNIFNYTNYGIYVGSTGNGNNWTISGNSFYYNNSSAASAATYAIYFYASTASNNNLIYGNFIGGQAPNCGGAAWTYAYAGLFYSIYVNVGTTNPTIVRKNTIKNINITSTGAAGIYGIYLYAGATKVDSNVIGDPSTEARVTEFINNNTNSFATANTNQVTGLNYDIQPEEPSIKDDYSLQNYSNVKSENVANSIVNNGTSVIRGIYLAATVVSEVFIQHNEICNLTGTNAGTGAVVHGMYNAAGGASIVHIWNNQIHHLAANSAATSLTGPAIAGIVWFVGTTPDWAQGDIVSNTIYSLVDTNMTAVGTNVMGVMLTNCRASTVGNHVYDIRNRSTGTTVTAPPTAVGFYIRYQGDVSAIVNNMASVGDGQTTNTQFIAFWNGAGSTNNYVMLHNSGLVTGTAASGDLTSFAFMRGNNSGTAVTTDIYARNNIFVNNRTGGTAAKHYAIGNQATTADTTGWDFDYNVLKSANPATFGLWGATDLTFNDWKLPRPGGTGGDLNSINADPGYMSVTNLHINPTSLVPNRRAISIEGATFDFDFETRNPNFPDIGADEYIPDAPSMFTLISPANGAITQPILGQLVWHASTLAEYYDVFLDAVNPPLTKVSTLQTETTYTYDLMPNMTYYWKIVAQNDTGMCPGDGSASSPVWNFSTEIWNVGPTAIIKPSAIGFAGNNIIPQVKVKNFGSGTVTFPVTMKIGTVYTNTKTVNNLIGGDSIIVNFDPWTAVLGTYNLVAYTGLMYDNNLMNDTIRGSTEIQPPAHNVGTMYIIAPVDTILDGAVVAPSARIKNFGAFTETFVVRFKIGSGYNQTKTISNFISNAETTLVFPNWTATQGNYLVRCSTELAIDQIPEDDKIEEMLTVKYVDAGIGAVLSPPYNVTLLDNYTPTIIINNNGVNSNPVLCTLNFTIVRYPAEMMSYCNIGRSENGVVVYQEQYITMISEGTDTIYLPEWTPYWWDMNWLTEPTFHFVTAEVIIPNDMNSTNNLVDYEVFVNGLANDLQTNWTGLLQNYMPMHDDTLVIGTYNVASAVSATSNTDFRAKVQIWQENTNSLVYARYLDENLEAMSYICLPFQSGWTPTEPGWYRVVSWIETRPGLDVNAENNMWERYYYFTNMTPTIANGNTNQTTQNNTITPNIPTAFGLSVRPNPVSDRAIIEWQIPVTSDVRISIYDATGRVIKTLANSNYNAGYHNVTWNRTDDNNQKVASGIYFYEMKANNYISRQKLVIR